MTTDIGDVPNPSETQAPGGAGARVLANRYRVGRRIGAGGMATILRGEDPQMERMVAIKVLHAHLADDPEVRRRFVAEAHHAASLSHPNIVTIYDQGESDLPWIVMELVEGPSLREVLNLHGPLSASEMLAVVQPLAGALAAAHRVGMVHRDVKPENVLVTPAGTPKLVDFGIARVMAATSHTTAGTLVGSVHYMAPELVDGVDATPASDQYALGVLAFELLTGRKPLPADTPMAVALRHANEDVPAPSTYAPDVPAAVDAAIARATSRRATDRFSGVEEFGVALAAAVADGPSSIVHAGDDGRLNTLIIPSAHMPTTTIPREDITEDDDSPAAADLRERRRQRGPVAAAPRTPRRWPRRLGKVVLTLLVLAVGGLAGFLAWTELLNPPIPVDDLAGLTRGEAFRQLELDGLTLEILSEAHQLDIPAGVVTGQEPPAGTELARGDAVGVHLSLGPRVVDMPNFVGQPFADLADVLAENAFEVQTSEANDDDIPAGAVISQTPAADQRLEQGSTIALVISLGIEQVTVPQVVNLTEQQATEALGAERLEAEITYEWSDEVPESGTVIRQDTLAGLDVDAPSTVTLAVSRGPLTIETPDLRGMSVQDALAAIEDIEDIVAETFSEPVPTLGPFVVGNVNRVERQDPSPGEPVQRGGTITIYYFTG